MTLSHRMNQTDRERPSYPIGPVLEHYGFDAVDHDRGWRDIRCAFHGDRNASGRVRSDDSTEQVYYCHAYRECPNGNAVQIIMKKEGLAYRDAVIRATEITGVGDGEVRRSGGPRDAVPRKSRTESKVSAFKRTWLRD